MMDGSYQSADDKIRLLEKHISVLECNRADNLKRIETLEDNYRKDWNFDTRLSSQANRINELEEDNGHEMQMSDIRLRIHELENKPSWLSGSLLDTNGRLIAENDQLKSENKKHLARIDELELEKAHNWQKCFHDDDGKVGLGDVLDRVCGYPKLKAENDQLKKDNKHLDAANKTLCKWDAERREDAKLGDIREAYALAFEPSKDRNEAQRCWHLAGMIKSILNE